MQRLRSSGDNAFKASVRVAAALLFAIPLLVSGCSAATSISATPLVISPNAAEGPDYIARGSIDGPADEHYFELVLKQTFNTVIVMTAGPTDTAGQVETKQRMPITMICEGIRPEAEPPCVWGSDGDIDTPNAERSAMFNSMAPSGNFIWEGKLAEGVYYIRVTGQNGSTGPYDLTVETNNMIRSLSELCPANSERWPLPASPGTGRIGLIELNRAPMGIGLRVWGCRWSAGRGWAGLGSRRMTGSWVMSQCAGACWSGWLADRGS